MIDKEQNLHVFENPETLSFSAAEFIMQTANDSVKERGRFVIALSGGTTPELLFSTLAEEPFQKQIPWAKTFVFWGDERCVPKNDERNNANKAFRLLLSKVSVSPAHVFPVPVDIAPAEAAREYANSIISFFQPELPRFDIVLLGLGTDGHTASLFPGTDVLKERSAWVKEVYTEELKMYRITMTIPLLNQARHIVFLVTGKNKSSILQNVLSDVASPQKYPAQLINPLNGKMHWFVDRMAALHILI